MNTRRHRSSASIVPALLVILAACSGDDDGPTGVGGTAPAQLSSVSPAGGSTNVDPDGLIVIEFSQAMHEAMKDYADLHQGDVNGPTVAGVWAWSNANTRLIFTPAQPLIPATAYVIHLGGGMMDAQGHRVDFQSHGPRMGGQWATGDMMNGAGGGMMPGNHGHMGEGWQHANGSYGMIFTFTTSG